MPSGAPVSAKRIDAHPFEMTFNINRKVRNHSTFEVAADGKNGDRETVHNIGQPNPQTYVYDNM